MKKRLILCAFLITGAVRPFTFAHAVMADDDTPIISMTRDAMPLSKLPTNVSVIKAVDIELMGAHTLADVLRLVPSANLTQTGYGNFANVKLRGDSTANTVQIFVDDQPRGGVAQQNVDLSLIPLDNIERIEVVRGGSSVIYGANTTGGIINIITKKNNGLKTSADLSLEAGSFQTRETTWRAGTSNYKWNTFFTGQQSKSDGFQKNSDSDIESGSASSDYTFDNGFRIAANVDLIDLEVGDPQGTPVKMPDWDGEKEKEPFNENTRVNQERSDGRIKLDIPMGSLGMIQNQTFGSRLKYTYFDLPGMFSSASDHKEKIFGNDTRFLLSHGWSIGTLYQWEQRTGSAEAEHHITNLGGYVQKKFEWDQFLLIPAVRYDQHSVYGSETNPRITAVYNVLPRWNVSANIARSFRAPNFSDLYFYNPAFSFRGNPNLEPETAWTYDLGQNVQLTDNSAIKVTGYFTKMEDRIERNPATDMPENIPKAEITGVETELNSNNEMGQFGSIQNRVSYGYQRAKSSGVNRSHYVQTKLVPAHLLTFQSTINKNTWALTNVVRYSSYQYSGDDRTGQKLPSYYTWDARLSKTIKAVELFTSVENINDKRYATFPGYPMYPRTYWGGCNIKFGPLN